MSYHFLFYVEHSIDLQSFVEKYKDKYIEIIFQLFSERMQYKMSIQSEENMNNKGKQGKKWINIIYDIVEKFEKKNDDVFALM